MLSLKGIEKNIYDIIIHHHHHHHHHHHNHRWEKNINKRLLSYNSICNGSSNSKGLWNRRMMATASSSKMMDANKIINATTTTKSNNNNKNKNKMQQSSLQTTTSTNQIRADMKSDKEFNQYGSDEWLAREFKKEKSNEPKPKMKGQDNKDKDKDITMLSVIGLTKQITRDSRRHYLFEELNFTAMKGMKIGLLGYNGVGKSSLMKIVASLDRDYDGKIIYGEGSGNDRKLTIGYLEQETTGINKKLTVYENVMSGLSHVLKLQKRFEEIVIEMSNDTKWCDYDNLLREQEEITKQLDMCQGWNVEEKVKEACKALKCPDLHSSCQTLSGGEMRRVALAKVLLSNPDVMLLDEPTNHLDISSVEWLEEFVKKFNGVVMCVTHDRVFMQRTCNHIFELDQGKLYEFAGAYTDWIQKKSRMSFSHDKNLQKLTKQMEREYMLLKSNKSKARMNKIEQLQKMVTENAITPFIGYEPSLLIPQGPLLRTGEPILDVNHLYYERDNIQFVKDLSISLTPGMIVGIVGPNGIGKSTLIKLLCGQLEPDRGRIHWHESAQVGYIDQTRQGLNDSNMVWQEITQNESEVRIHEEKVINSRHYVQQFGFTGKSQEKLVRHLSGGERNRVYLAKSLRHGYNVLVLDEPSNDLDMDTLRKLEECMETFRGLIIVVSHDRYFLDRICTHIVAITCNPQSPNVRDIETFRGNYSEYLQKNNKTQEAK